MKRQQVTLQIVSNAIEEALVELSRRDVVAIAFLVGNAIEEALVELSRRDVVAIAFLVAANRLAQADGGMNYAQARESCIQEAERMIQSATPDQTRCIVNQVLEMFK